MASSQHDWDAGPVMEKVEIGSTWINDMRPEKPLSESFCLEQLTSYEVHRIIPGSSIPGSSIGMFPDGSPVNNWTETYTNQEVYPQHSIIETICELDRRCPVPIKKLSLNSDEITQVNNFVRRKTLDEPDVNFNWVLAQLHYEESGYYYPGRMDISSITLYFKRFPRGGVNVIDLYRTTILEREDQELQMEGPETQYQEKQQGQRQMSSSQHMDERKEGFVIFDRPPTPISIKDGLVPQNSASQERNGSMPLESTYDLNQQDQRNTNTPGYRSRYGLFFCHLCNDGQGFRGAHELRRHKAHRHNDLVKKWMCIEPLDGVKDDFRPVLPLAACKVCRQQKQYDTYYEAAAHLCHAHFAPKPPGSNNSDKADDNLEKPEVMRGRSMLLMKELMRWIKDVNESSDAVQQNGYEKSEEEQQPQPAMDNHPQDVVGTLAVAAAHAATTTTMPPQRFTPYFSLVDTTNEVACPLRCHDGSGCRKRCLGEKRYRLIQEHIRRAHPEHYISKLPATEESFQLMIIMINSQTQLTSADTRLREEKLHQPANLDVAMFANGLQSTAPMEQNPPQSPNSGQTQKSHQSFSTPWRNMQQAQEEEDLGEIKIRKQAFKDIGLAGETGVELRPLESSSLLLEDYTSNLDLLSINRGGDLTVSDIEDINFGRHLTGSRFLQEQVLRDSLQESIQHTTVMDEVVVDEPFTDSGYASILKRNMSKNDSPLSHQQQCHVDDTSNFKMGDDDTDDAKTVYSAATTIDLPHSQQYIAELCGGIFCELEKYFDSTNWDALEIALPSLIKAFAVKIGHDSSAQVNQDIMYFIHKQHKDIISHLKSMFFREDEEQPNHRRNGPKDMSLIEKMSMWDNKSSEIDTLAENNELFEGVRDDDDEITNEVGLSMYHGIILKSPSYEWFLSSLRNECFLQWSSRQPRIMVENIRRKILNILPTRTISKRHPLTACEVTFDLQRDNATDREKGLFTNLLTSETLLSELITVTGCQEESQVLTVAQYLRQTWPTNGLQLLNVLQKAIIHYDHHFSVILADNTQLDATIRSSGFIITATGPAQFIAECAEQLAWLQAALLSNSRDQTGYCAPSIENYAFNTIHSRSSQVKHEGYCDIAVEITPLVNPTDAVPQKRSWWQDLVGNGVIIQGFPISRRPKAYPGLELSFELLLSSVRTDRAIIDDGLVLLKGPVLTLQLLKVTNEVFLWLPFHPRNGFCSCEEHNVEISPNLSYSSFDVRRLNTGRHIVGVCTDLPTTTADSERMCAKLSLPETKCAQHHASRDIGPSSNLLNTAYNFDEIRPKEILPVPLKFQDDTKESRSSASSQVDYSVSKNGLPLCTENLKDHLLSDDQSQLAPDSPSNSTMPSQDESLDSDWLSLSDSSEQFEVPEGNAAVCAFIDEAVKKLLSGFRSTTQCQFSPSASGDSGQSVTQTAATGNFTTFNNSGRSGKKRRAADDDDDAGQGGFFKPPNKRNCHSPDKALQRWFACPYLKKDPVKHSKCCKKQLSRVRDVKQHLNRCHIPDRYCPRCLESDFCSDQALIDHIGLVSCVENTDPTSLDGISNTQQKRLKCKSNPKISEEDQWFAIWEILFGGRARPRSVYMDKGLSMELRLFREYCDTHGPSVVGGQHESNPIWFGSESTPEQRQAFLQTIVAEGMNTMFEEYRRSTRLESLSQNASYLEQSGDGIQHAQSEATLSSMGDSGIAVDSQASPRDINSRRYIPSRQDASFLEQRGDSMQPARYEAPLSSIADIGAAVDGQYYSPLDISSRGHIPSQPAAIFNYGGPGSLTPHDEMMQIPPNFGDDLLDFSKWLAEHQR